jgi:hypothetical protein
VARSTPAPRKQRTRQHVIADQSVNHIERVIIDEGHTAQRLVYDYGYDLEMLTYDAEGYVETGAIYLQLKAAEALEESGTDYVFDIDVRDYNLWIAELQPVVLVLFDATRRRAYYLHVQHYFRQTSSRQPRTGAKTVRVRVPSRQPFTRRAVAQLRELKQMLLNRFRVMAP